MLIMKKGIEMSIQIEGLKVIQTCVLDDAGNLSELNFKVIVDPGHSKKGCPSPLDIHMIIESIVRAVKRESFSIEFKS